jgi:hypothetical protein
MSYNPIFDIFNIEYKSNITNYKKITYNEYEITDNQNNTFPCYVKFITLLDYVKILIGKYKKYDLSKTTFKSNTYNNKYDKYINSIHNYSFVDSFFYLLSSHLKKHGFVHSLEFYDYKLILNEKCEINIVEDFEYLSDCDYFNKNLDTYYRIKDNLNLILNNEIDKIFLNNDEQNDEQKKNNENKNVENTNNETNCKENNTFSSTCSSSDSESDSDSDSDSGSDSDSKSLNETNNSINSIDDDSDIDNVDEIILEINNIVCNKIAIEKCDNTLEYLLNNKINNHEMTSIIFQILIILHVYQTVFKLTHNDLHICNIMYIKTDDEYINYKLNNKYYKVPTFGKIIKIIDFGRAIYSYKNTRLCSDSFSINGTAYGQYNCEPFYNQNKDKIEPNFSFDLCRLACSIYETIDYNEIENYRKIPIYSLIYSWLIDDKNKNILYNDKGEERYNDFKIYKKIAKNCNNIKVNKQFTNECFNNYLINNTDNYINIDTIIETKIEL